MILREYDESGMHFGFSVGEGGRGREGGVREFGVIPVSNLYDCFVFAIAGIWIRGILVAWVVSSLLTYLPLTTTTTIIISNYDNDKDVDRTPMKNPLFFCLYVY